MIATPFTDLQTQRGDFTAVHIYTPRIGIAVGLNAPITQNLHHSGLEQRDQLSDIDVRTTQIVEHIGDPLAGTVIGHLTAAIDLNNGHVTRVEHVFRLTG